MSSDRPGHVLVTTQVQWPARSALQRAWAGLDLLPEVWTGTARKTRERDGAKDGAEDRYEDRYARGLASGLDVAAELLREPLQRLLRVLPPCEHGIRVDQKCRKGCG
jgi:hypothetical protein